MRDEFEMTALTVVALVKRGVIDPKRYSDHQLAIYLGVTQDQLRQAREQVERHGLEEARPRKPEPRPKATPGPGARGGRREPDGRDPVEAERDQFVAIRQAKPLRQLAAYFTVHEGDDCIDEECEACGRPIRVGDGVRVVGTVFHAECP